MSDLPRYPPFPPSECDDENNADCSVARWALFLLLPVSLLICVLVVAFILCRCWCKRRRSYRTVGGTEMEDL